MVAWKWSITLAKSKALDQGIASLGQNLPVVKRLRHLDQEKSDVALKQGGAEIPIANELEFLACREWRFRQAAGRAHLKLAEGNDKDDIPVTQSEQKELANNLSQAAMNEVGMVDQKNHGDEDNKRLNFIVRRKRDLSTLDIALFGWETSLALRDSHLGLTKESSSIVGLDIQPYETFKKRGETLTKLFKVSTQLRIC